MGGGGLRDSSVLHVAGSDDRRWRHPGEDLPEGERAVEEAGLHGGGAGDLAEAEGGVGTDEIVVEPQDLERVFQARGAAHLAGRAALQVGDRAAQVEVQALDEGGVRLVRVLAAREGALQLGR